MTLVAAHMEVTPPPFVKVVRVTSAADMAEAILPVAAEYDCIIKAAAVSDYTPVATSTEKIKKADGTLTVSFQRTTDILKTLGEHKPEHLFLCGFSMETENVIENSRKKLQSKHCDMICANSLRKAGAGFGGDTNIITILTAEREIELEQMTKDEAAHRILDTILESGL